MKHYPLIVIGGGPAGYTSALYGARAGLSTLVIEQAAAGGQMLSTPEIDNYPGVPLGIDGFTLGQQMQEQAEKCGAETFIGTVTAVDLKSKPKTLQLADGSAFSADAVILAMGSSPRKLGVPGEAEFGGRGVSYCATCDGMFFRKKTVVIVGGGNTAIEDALYLSNLCKHVYLVHRRDEFRAEAISVNRLKTKENVTFLLKETLREIVGKQKVTGVILNSGKQVDCDGVFIAVGEIPNSGLVAEHLTLSREGYVPAGESTETELPGVFVAGDLRDKELRQIVTAAADGAMAAHMAAKLLHHH